MTVHLNAQVRVDIKETPTSSKRSRGWWASASRRLRRGARVFRLGPVFQGRMGACQACANGRPCWRRESDGLIRRGRRFPLRHLQT